MRNVWKGLVVGALTGMAGGVMMDMGIYGRDKAADLIGRSIDKAPSVAKVATHKARQALAEVDISPDRVRESADKARGVVQQVAHSEAADKAKKRVGLVS